MCSYWYWSATKEFAGLKHSQYQPGKNHALAWRYVPVKMRLLGLNEKSDCLEKRWSKLLVDDKINGPVTEDESLLMKGFTCKQGWVTGIWNDLPCNDGWTAVMMNLIARQWLGSKEWCTCNLGRNGSGHVQQFCCVSYPFSTECPCYSIKRPWCICC